jgi:hypothetical protein
MTRLFILIAALLALCGAPAFAQTQFGPVTPTSAAGLPRTDKVSTMQGCPTCTHIGVDQGAQAGTGTAATGWWYQGIETAGSAVTGGGVRVMGSDGVYARDLLTDTAGRILSSGYCAAASTAPSYTAGANPCSMDLAGDMRVVGANDGAPATGVSQPSGGAGALGWLSGIYKAVTGTLTVIGSVTGNVPYIESTTPLGANASFSGGAHAVPSWASYFTCRSTASGGGGSLAISSQGNPITNDVSVSTTGSVTSTMSERVSGTANVYCVYFNGTTAQTSFYLTSSFTAN